MTEVKIFANLKIIEDGVMFAYTYNIFANMSYQFVAYTIHDPRVDKAIEETFTAVGYSLQRLRVVTTLRTHKGELLIRLVNVLFPLQTRSRVL